jgi:primosomal replication protein N
MITPQESATNDVTLMGKIVSECTLSHQLYGETFYEVELEVPRLSAASDKLLITFSERLVSKDTMSIGTVIDVKGQLRSYNNYQGTGNRLKLTVFAREISIVESGEISKNPNQIFLDGFLCKKPMSRETPFGREIADLILAVNRLYNKSDYIPIITWGRNAKFCDQLNVGDNIRVWGRVQSRPYQKKQADGTVIDKVAYEVSVSKMEVVPTNNNKTGKEEEEQ